MNTIQMPLAWLAAHCRSQLMNEKWLLVENLRIGQQWKDGLTLGGHATINLHAKTLNTVAVGLSACVLAKRNLRYVGSATTHMLIRKLVVKLLEQQELDYFAEVSNIDSLANLALRTFNDLRLAKLEPHCIGNSLVAGDFESEAKGRDLHKLFHAYRNHLDACKSIDYAGGVQLAITGICDGSIVLPTELLVLLPEELQLSALESELLTALANHSQLATPSDNHWSLDECRALIREAASSRRVTFGYSNAMGEANEVRQVFQRITTSDTSVSRLDDIELLYTDYRSYVPVIMEQLSLWLNGVAPAVAPIITVDELPVTFAEGIACVYSRPGRALRSWIRWLRSDGMQSKAVQILREGLLVRPDDHKTVGYTRLANALRDVPIAFGLQRYLSQIDASIKSSQVRRDDYLLQLARGETEAQERGADWDAGLKTLQTVRSMVAAMVEVAPQPNDSSTQVLQKARRFLLNCARAESKFDRTARSKLLDDIDGLIESSAVIGAGDFDVTQWLEELPIDSRVLGSGPHPGCIHVANLDGGGFSGRKQLFVIGLDESRYPRRASIDPLLLDTERQALSEKLTTSMVRSERYQRALLLALKRAIERSCVEVTLSYSTRHLAEDRLQYASPGLLDLYRLTHQADAQLSKLLSTSGTEASFVSTTNSAQLSISEIEFAEHLSQPDPLIRRTQIEARHPHFARSRLAMEAIAATAFGSYDGFVPAAGIKLDPNNSSMPMSANRFETFGTCPRRYFFQYGLGVWPPDQLEVDTDRWLDALQFGSLVHSVFEEFLRGHTQHDLVPDRRRDSQPLQRLLQSKLDEKLQEIPIPNQDAYLRQREELLELCDVFLQKEESYCRSKNARPWILEASVGMEEEPRSAIDCQEPVTLTLSDGRIMRLRGRIDRIDRLDINGSEHYAIWDYKSGSAWGFDQANPFQGGRKLQPFLYVGMLRHRIAAMGGLADAVTSFGYFFPSAKAEGRRIEWTYGELRTGDAVLRRIFDLIQRGVFIATDNAQDCTYCNYRSVCNDFEWVTRQAKAKATDPGNRETLLPWIELRELSQ